MQTNRTTNNYVISAGHEKTAEAAELILQAGGNAVDAAIAAFLMSWVAEPCMSSGGGGGFATIFSARKNRATVFDFFCQTPQQKRPMSEVDFYPIEVDFGDTKETFQVGKGSTGTPGAVAGVFAMHEQYGTIPMRELVQPAIHAAKEGVAVVPFQYLDFQLLQAILEIEPKGRDTFLENGVVKSIGTPIYMPELADFLDYMASEGKAAFYQGEVAQKMAADYQAGGGFLSMDDFEKYQVKRLKPLTFNYRNQQILTNPLPSFGGKLIQLGLDYLAQQKMPEKTGNLAHQQILYGLSSHLEKVGKESQHFAEIPNPIRGNTTHFSIIDAQGNAVSLTASNGEGCGYFVENTGIQLNNMLGEAALLPAGFHSWQTNTRLSSMMSPTIVLDEEDRLSIVTGSSGAGRIPGAIIQVLSNLIDYKKDVHEAVNAPRLHVTHGTINIEPNFKEAFILPANRGEAISNWTEQSLYFGGANTVVNKNGNLGGGADLRRDGVVLP